MSRQSIHDAINDTCDAKWDVLAPEYMPKPKRADKASEIVGDSLTA